jgi:hypothetical protein
MEKISVLVPENHCRFFRNATVILKGREVDDFRTDLDIC